MMILIASKADDNHALAVAHILESKYSEKVFIFDTSNFPTSVLFSANFNNSNFNFSLIAAQNQNIELQNIKSFWWRRPQPMSIDPKITNPQARNFAFNECVSALYGMLECCEGLWVNDLKYDNTADYKPYQLKTASQIGFQIPDTLITNDPDRVLDFRQRHNGKVIYKAFNQRGLIWRPTRLLKVEDLTLIHNVRLAPVIFQSSVRGRSDIRVTVIGEEIFATEFAIQDDECIDYRLNITTAPCHSHALPAEIIDKLHHFMCALGLEYGGIDFRLTPKGSYVFLEINTAGEFMYLQERTGQPIAEAMASHLARGKRVNIPKKRIN